MSIEKTLSTDGKTLTLIMDDKFDFSKVQDFHDSYDDVTQDLTSVVLDLAQTTFIDSSALGMLLNMQKTLGDSGISYHIINCQAPVLRILQVSRFDKKFAIS